MKLNGSDRILKLTQKYPALWLLPFALLLIVYFIGLFIDVMDVDAAQYAEMSREMMLSRHYLKVMELGHNYLDKPPLLFWLTSLSYAAFGVSNFAFKLPSLLFGLLAVFSTYKLARLYYSFTTAYIAALMLASCQMFFVFVNDVRTDTMLTGSVIFAIWQLGIFFKSGKYINCLAGFFGIGLAMLAKGPIGLMLPVFAFGSEILLKRQWKLIFKWQWLSGLFIIALMLAPMLYGLYEQYGAMGPKFYLWTQSFGRITGESEWKNDASVFFFVQNIAWEFLPWTAFLFLGVLWKVGVIIKHKFFMKDTNQYFVFGSFLLGFIALSLSKYKLPHYIYVLMPLASIITAEYISHLLANRIKIYKAISSIMLILLPIVWILAIALCTYFFPSENFIVVIVGVVLFLVFMIGLIKFPAGNYKFIALAVLTMMGANFMLDASVYPSLLKFQSDNAIGRWINANKVEANRFFAYEESTKSINYYSRMGVPVIWGTHHIDSICNKNASPMYLRVERAKLPEITNPENKYKIDTIMSLPYYPVALLSINFINKETRPSVLRKLYLLKISKNN